MLSIPEQTADYPPGTKVRFYIEARSGNSSKTASFSPPRAEQQTWSYRVALATAPSTPVIINEIMADNQTAFADPQGEFDDWIELHNLTDHEIDISGRYLSDEPNNPRKW
ncbi:MAG: lamin tail domain-containing protein, partial [Verrucomicrobiia bacterium]